MAVIMTASPARSADESLTKAGCVALLRRVCFGHLAFARQGHVDIAPVRYVLVDGWVYFRANRALRDRITRTPWLALSVTEPSNGTRMTSVIVRGGCYETERTGSATDDAAALRGIMELRDRATVGPRRAPRVQRRSTVFRLHVAEMRGVKTYVPCPPGERPYDSLELQHMREAGRDQSVREDQRADDDGMAEPNPPTPVRSARSRSHARAPAR